MHHLIFLNGLKKLIRRNYSWQKMTGFLSVKSVFLSWRGSFLPVFCVCHVLFANNEVSIRKKYQVDKKSKTNTSGGNRRCKWQKLAKLWTLLFSLRRRIKRQCPNRLFIISYRHLQALHMNGDLHKYNTWNDQIKENNLKNKKMQRTTCVLLKPKDKGTYHYQTAQEGDVGYE